MVLGGVNWQMRWFVLDAEADRAMEEHDSGGSRVPRNAQLVAYDSEVAEIECGVPIPLAGLTKVELQQRRTEAGGWIVANFALQSPRRSWEFASRSEEEAREWANAFDQTLFRMSSKAANVVRV